jgi:A/G-specific adenine glycosylase
MFVMPTAQDRHSTERAFPAYFSIQQRRRLRRQLFTWYKSHARDLPWRASIDPYRVWISEIMLQQTQVATVRDYFTRFVAALPDVHRLAAADERRVLRLWEGLGYYRRARQLHAAAKRIVSEHGGNFPQDPSELQTLPGIGRYTAGAIASIAFNRRAAILEANTIRLLSRLIGYRDDPHRAAGQRVLWQVAEAILPRTNVAEFNQALMELGSLVCAHAEPKCHECPLSSLCAARAAGLQKAIPPAKDRQNYTQLREAAIVVRRNGRVLMRQCAQGERWAGLWDFPRFELKSSGPLFDGEEIMTKVRETTGITCAPGPLWKTLKHGVTRYRIRLDCYEAAYVAGRALSNNFTAAVRWIRLKDLDTLPLSTTGRTIAKLVSKRASEQMSG